MLALARTGKSKATATTAKAAITVATIMVFRRMAVTIRNKRDFEATKRSWSLYRVPTGNNCLSSSYFIGYGKQKYPPKPQS